MKKTIGVFILLFLFVNASFAKKKKERINGYGIDIFQPYLNNIAVGDFSGYNSSLPEYTQHKKLSFGINYIITRPIYKNFSLETGLGLSNFNSQFQFLRNGEEPNPKLNINLFYLKLPILANYAFKINNTSSINLSVGANLRLLLYGTDNYLKIIKLTIGLPRGKYNYYYASQTVAIGYNHNLKQGQKVRIEANAGVDLENLNHFKWGFFTFLSSSNYSYCGISLKYFFTKNKSQL